MLSHISLGVSSLERAEAFYDAAMSALGFVQVWKSKKGIGYGPPGKNDKLAVIEVKGADGKLSGRGSQFAFQAQDRDSVHRFHEAALSAGGTCDGEPGPRPQYSDTYYASSVLDPDGRRLEAVHQ